MDTDKFNIFFTGLVVGAAEKPCKVRVAHVAMRRQILYLQLFIIMVFNILGDFFKCLAAGGRILFFPLGFNVPF